MQSTPVHSSPSDYKQFVRITRYDELTVLFSNRVCSSSDVICHGQVEIHCAINLTILTQ